MKPALVKGLRVAYTSVSGITLTGTITEVDATTAVVTWDRDFSPHRLEYFRWRDNPQWGPAGLEMFDL